MAMTNDGTKTCKKCGVSKPAKEFYLHQYTRDGLRNACKPCLLAQNAERLKKNPDYSKNYRQQNLKRLQEYDRARRKSPEDRQAKAAYDRKWRRQTLAERRRASLRRSYGITLEQYQSMEKQQNHGCAICGKPPEKRALAVDHCHATGKVRGLLCAKHNTGIGLFEDSPELLKAAILYLERTR